MNWYKIFGKKEVVFSAPLKEKDGFYYLDIPQAFITGLWSMMDEDADEAPYKQKQYGAVGAHVSVISDEELDDDVEIEEIGQDFEFTILGAKQTNPEGWDEMKQVYFIEIDSPQIKEMRKKYGLPKSYQGKKHQFHITFSLERK